MSHRYADGSHPESRLHEPLLTVTGARVDVIGTDETYPFFGPDLSNTVDSFNAAVSIDTPPPDAPCRYWRRTLSAEPAYLAVMNGWLYRAISPEDRERWFASDSAMRTIDDGDGFSVYRHERPLDPAEC